MTSAPKNAADTQRQPDEEVGAARPRARRREVLLLAVLAAVVAAVVGAAFWPVLSAQAISFDGAQFVTENPLVQNPSWQSAGRFLREVLHPSTVKGYYLPLSMISLMLDYAAGGRPDDLRVFHRTSLALRVLNSVLVIVLIYSLFQQVWPAALLGLLFGLHPLTVEPVAWVGERKTLLAAFFALWCLILYVRYTRHARWRWAAASLVTYVLALMSKPTAAPLPVLLLLLDWWPLRRIGKRALLEKLPYVVIGGIFVVITLVSHFRTPELMAERAAPAPQALLMFCYLIVFYLGKIVWPASLTSLYAMPDPLALSNGIVLASVVGTLVLIAGLAVSLRRTPALAIGWLFFFLAIFPTLGALRYSWVAASDKYMYLPIVGFLLILAWLLGLAWGRAGASRPLGLRVGLVAVVACVALAEAGGMRRYLACWQDSETLFRHMIAVNPRGWQAHNQLASCLVAAGRMDEGFEHYAAALRIEPDDYTVYGNLALASLRVGKYQEAIEYSQTALKLRPDCAQAHFALAGALFHCGRIEESIRHYTEALRLKPYFPEAHYNLGHALVRAGRVPEAIQQYLEVLRLNPAHYEAHYYVAHQLCRLGRFEEGLAHYDAVLRLKPDFAETHRLRGHALLELHRVDEAIEAYRAAVRVNPGDVNAAFRLATCLESQGRIDEAVQAYRRTLEIAPGHAEARARLDALLAVPSEAADPDGEVSP
jgi:tetratricopeptide (TPR) repeat protein